MRAKNYGTGSLRGSNREELLQDFLQSADWEFKSSEKAVPVEKWVEGLKLTGGEFTWEGHEWQREILVSDYPRICIKKAAQIGATAIFILKILYNLIFGRYPQGCGTVMPTVDAAISYSKSRFAPMIDDNPQIKRLVSSTDSATLKKVKRSFLHFVGGQLTSSLEKGLKKSSTALKSTPLDCLLIDEVDEIPTKSLDLAKERLSHSRVKHEFYLSTPSVPDYGIDALYQSSDQRIWVIKCPSCGRDCCLELDFPDCVKFKDGKAYRACVRCGAKLLPSQGLWVPQSPGQDIHGYWISQLASPFVDPGEILKVYNEPPHGNLQEVMNSKLGRPYVPSENKLTVQDVFRACGDKAMLPSHHGPCAAGIDVGKFFHVTIGFRPEEKQRQIAWIGRLSNLSDLSDVCHRFNVKIAVVDAEPETRAVREWQKGENFQIFLCDYVSTVLNGPQFNEDIKTLKVNRTEALDAVHDALTSPGRIVLPKRCDGEMEEFASQATNAVKVLEEDEFGGRRYVWRKTGPDHYQHSLGYFLLAASRIGIAESEEEFKARQYLESVGVTGEKPYSPLTFGLGDGSFPLDFGLNGDSYDPLNF